MTGYFERAPAFSIPLLRIVPDDTKFDFMRFRRISFPISALLSIVAIVLFFHPWPQSRHRFQRRHADGGAGEVGPADLAQDAHDADRRSASATSSCSSSAAPADVLIRIAQQPGGEAAQQAAVDKVKRRARRRLEYRRVEVVGPRVSSELLSYGTIGIIAGDRRDPDLSLVPLRVAVCARRHDRQRARPRADARLHVADADRFRPDLDRRAADHPRLFAQRYRRHLRPHPRDAAALQEACRCRNC